MRLIVFLVWLCFTHTYQPPRPPLFFLKNKQQFGRETAVTWGTGGKGWGSMIKPCNLRTCDGANMCANVQCECGQACVTACVCLRSCGRAWLGAWAGGRGRRTSPLCCEPSRTRTSRLGIGPKPPFRMVKLGLPDLEGMANMAFFAGTPLFGKYLLLVLCKYSKDYTLK